MANKNGYRPKYNLSELEQSFDTLARRNWIRTKRPYLTTETEMYGELKSTIRGAWADAVREIEKKERVVDKLPQMGTAVVFATIVWPMVGHHLAINVDLLRNVAEAVAAVTGAALLWSECATSHIRHMDSQQLDPNNLYASRPEAKGSEAVYKLAQDKLLKLTGWH